MADKKKKEDASEVDTSSEAQVEEAAVGEDAAAGDETAAGDEASSADAPKARKPRAKAKKSVVKVLTPQERQAARDEVRHKKAIARRSERAQARAKYKAGEHERQATPPREHAPGAQKTRQGVVVSDRADKTITVRIDVARRHRRYSKVVRTSNTVHAHDERNEAHIGDTVVVRESRPLSRTKRWRLIDVVERAK
jgi:small subunit ribosomal protein S17